MIDKRLGTDGRDKSKSKSQSRFVAASKSRQSLRNGASSPHYGLDPVLDHQAPLTREEALLRSKLLSKSSRKTIQPALPTKPVLAHSELLEGHEVIVDSADERGNNRRNRKPLVDEKIEEYRAWVQQRVASRQRELQQSRQKSQDEKERRSESLKRLASKTKIGRANTDEKSSPSDRKSQKSRPKEASPEYFAIESRVKKAPSPQPKQKPAKAPRRPQADPEAARRHKFEHFFGKHP